MMTSGIYAHDPVSKRYGLPEAHAALLGADAAQNLCPVSRMVNHPGSHQAKLAGCLRAGGGIPYSACRPVFAQRMDDAWRGVYDEQLVGGFIGVVDGLADEASSRRNTK
jgi:hypothetical protein